MSRRDWSRVGVSGHSTPWPLTQVVAFSLTLCFACVSLCHLALVEEFLEGSNTELVSSSVGLSSQGVTGADKTSTSCCRHNCRCCP